MTYKNIKVLLIILALFPSILICAQKKSKSGKTKQTKEEKVFATAINNRLMADQAYAQRKRPAYNRSSWVGGKLSDLIDKWGPPSRATTDGADGQIVVYDKHNDYAGGSYTPGYTLYNGYGQVVGGEDGKDSRWSSTYDEATSFYADKDKTIRKVVFQNRYQ